MKKPNQIVAVRSVASALALSVTVAVAVTVALATIAPATAQNLQTKNVIQKYSVDFVPEFKRTVVSQTGNAQLGNIDVAVDFASFGDNAEELTDAAAQLFHVKGALMALNKSPAARPEIERKFKTIVMVLNADASKRSMSLKNGTFTLVNTSYKTGKYFSSSDIQRYLEKAL